MNIQPDSLLEYLALAETVLNMTLERNSVKYDTGKNSFKYNTGKKQC